MRTIQRTIASALIFSKDGKLLMGKKDPAKGGVYPDCWHIPGGGIDEGESLRNGVIREVREEVGLDISNNAIEPIPFVDSGTTEKTLGDGEKVLCEMEFNRFKITISDKNADEITLNPSDDLVEMRWFSLDELADIKQVPSGRELFQRLGYIKA